MTVRALLVGADSLARSGLQVLLQGRPEVELLGAAASEGLDTSSAEVLIWDLGSQAESGLARLRALSAEVRILALIPEGRMASEALNAGARGVLLRDAASAELAAAALAVGAGHYVIDASVAGTIFPAVRPNVGAPEEPLTVRESQVLQLLSQGMANKSIAQHLGISEHTAKFHVNAIFSKLGVQSRTEAVIRAAKAGLIAL
jgi:two-component system, NarL family, nitrate/nitrite response regulator NarL